jgi:hypothetical protein
VRVYEIRVTDPRKHLGIINFILFELENWLARFEVKKRLGPDGEQLTTVLDCALMWVNKAAPQWATIRALLDLARTIKNSAK